MARGKPDKGFEETVAPGKASPADGDAVCTAGEDFETQA